MKIIVGLGNPGKEYINTRHNAGFMVIDQFRQTMDFPDWENNKKMKAYTTEKIMSGEKVILAKPTTFMNLSGESVTALSNFYKVPSENILVVFDELDIPFGSIKLRKNGGAGTHNGMKSIVEKLGTKDFPRLRFGIESRGASAPRQQDTTSFVLSTFLETEKEELKENLKSAEQAIKAFLEKGIESAMNSFN